MFHLEFTNNLTSNTLVVQDIVTLSDIVNATVSYNIAYTESAVTLGESSNALRVLVVDIIESVNMQDSYLPQLNYNTSIYENVVLTEYILGGGWIKISSDIGTGWGTISNAQSPNWTTIDDTQVPNWAPINDNQ